MLSRRGWGPRGGSAARLQQTKPRAYLTDAAGAWVPPTVTRSPAPRGRVQTQRLEGTSPWMLSALSFRSHGARAGAVR